MTKSIAMGWLLFAVVAVGCASGGKPATARIPAAELDEPALMDKLRLGAKSDPAAALALTEEGERRFGDSACAEERRALAIQALIDLNRIGAARSRAYPFLERYPEGPYAAHVAAMTGVHLTPKGPAGHASP
jgi:hypothetical protein